jgi:tetratricopeptide (TPR) repeat protein
MENFIARYPNSVVKMDAMEQAMAAYQQLGITQKVEQTALRILQIEPAHVRALAIVAYLRRTAATASGDAKMAQEAGAYARTGLAALPKWPKPEGISDEDFQKIRNEMAVIFHGAAGFAALEAKDYGAARDAFLKSLAIHPNDMQDNFQLAMAKLQMTPVEVNGFWYAAKAISLAQAQNNSSAADAIGEYARKMYIRYHGSEEGWQRLLTAAAGQNAPPEDFESAIKSDPKGK